MQFNLQAQKIVLLTVPVPYTHPVFACRPYLATVAVFCNNVTGYLALTGADVAADAPNCWKLRASRVTLIGARLCI